MLKITLVPELPEKAADRADLPTVSFHARPDLSELQPSVAQPGHDLAFRASNRISPMV